MTSVPHPRCKNPAQMCAIIQVSVPPTDEHREQDAGDHWHLSVLPGTYPSCQRCCAASAAHSGKTQGARPSPPLPTSLAPTDGDELSVKLMPIGRSRRSSWTLS